MRAHTEYVIVEDPLRSQAGKQNLDQVIEARALLTIASARLHHARWNEESNYKTRAKQTPAAHNRADTTIGGRANSE